MKNKLIKSSIIILLLIMFIIFIVLIFNKNKARYVARAPYEKIGFIDADELGEDKKFTLSDNERFNFTLDAKTTQFVLTDSITNQTWNSSATSLSGQANHEIELSELFTLYYERKLEAPKAMSIYSESIKYDSYMIRENADSLDVLYQIGGKRSITFDDLPRIVPKDKVEELIYAPLEELAETDSTVNRNLAFLKQRGFILSEVDNTYTLRQIDSQKTIEDMYNLIFNLSNYRYEDYLEDSERYGLVTEQEVPYFEFVVRYSVTNKGLRVHIINESIVESVNYMISYIDVLPFFGTTNLHEEGFSVIPDGSGIYINHNNGRHNAPAYNKRIYGSDLTIESPLELKPEAQESIKLPMYAYSNNNYGFINVVEEGDAMTNIRATFKVTTSAGSLTNKVAQTYYRFNLRERDYFEFRASLQAHNVTMWTNEYNKEDFIMQYIFVEDGSNYYKFAEEYQSYLKEVMGLEKTLSSNTVHLTFLGGYKKKQYFLGIPYTTVESLTSANEITKITNEINLDNYSVSYQGWSNEGIKPSSYEKINFNNKVASKKELKNLIKTMDELSVDLYLEVLTSSAYTKDKISLGKDINKTLLQNVVKYHQYMLSTNLADYKTMPNYRFNSNYETKVLDEIASFANKYNVKGLTIIDQGQSISSNYAKGNVMFRNEIINKYNEAFTKVEDKNIIFRNPNLYAILNSDKILDLPIAGTRNRIVDYSIPFIQLSLNGIIDYFGTSVNLDTSKSLKWHELKAIETGSKIQFTLTNKDTVELINTEYSEYFSTYYKNWVGSINEINDNLNNLGIYKSVIVNHKVLNADATLVEVEYSNGKIYTINYLNETILETGVIR